MSDLDDLAKELGLLQTPGKDAAKTWAQQTRELMDKGKTSDQAATIAAGKVFPQEFKPRPFKEGLIEVLLKRIETL